MFDTILTGYSKLDVLRLVHNAGIPLNELWSCYLPHLSISDMPLNTPPTPCGTCYHCIEFQHANELLQKELHT